MNKMLITLAVISTLIISCDAQPKNGAFEPVAVIELFTSEGCSSCPPADKLLARYNDESAYPGVKVFPLAFHVDYWNYLGWRDPFSSAENTSRQKMYIDALGLSGAYTPQMIVNGATQFVGSDESALKDALAVASKKKSIASFTKLNVVREGDNTKIEYALQGEFKDCEIHFALVSLQASTQVRRGENVGRKLNHTNVVRQFLTVKANSSGEVTLKNAGLALDNTAVIAYVQQSHDHQIIAAVESR